MQSTIQTLPGSTREVSVIIPSDAFLAFEDKAIENVNARIEIPGFRKGKATKEALLKHIGDMALLEEMAELALSDAYPKIIKEHNLDAIGRPEIRITKIARGNPLEFTFKTAVVPEISLPDYKKVAKEEMSKELKTEVTNDDVEKTILEVRQMRAHQELHKDGDHDNHEHGDALDEKNLPPFDDAFAKSLGKFDSVEDFKVKIRENIALEKEREANDKRRASILDALIVGTTTEVPAILIHAEQEKMFGRMSYEIEKAGLKMDEYLKHLNKTKEELFETWREEAHKQATLELVIDKIAEIENLRPTDTEVTTQAEEVTKAYPGSDIERAKVYVEHMLTNQKVLAFLEAQK